MAAPAAGQDNRQSALIYQARSYGGFSLLLTMLSHGRCI